MGERKTEGNLDQEQQPPKYDMMELWSMYMQSGESRHFSELAARFAAEMEYVYSELMRNPALKTQSGAVENAILVGLYKLVRTYTETKGASLKTFVNRYLKNRAIDELRTAGLIPQRSTDKNLPPVSLDALINPDMSGVSLLNLLIDSAPPVHDQADDYHKLLPRGSATRHYWKATRDQ